MLSSHDTNLVSPRHAGPNPGMVAAVFAALFLAAGFAGSAGGALQFGAAIPLGIFTATMSSRLRFHGVRAAGTYIALFGGIAAAIDMLAGGAILRALSDAAVRGSEPLAGALDSLAFAFGGPGFAAPFGLLAAGVSVTAGFSGLLPRWIVVPGLMVAACGELSWLALIFPHAGFLVPLTRFCGCAWAIAAGFVLPAARKNSLPQTGVEHEKR